MTDKLKVPLAQWHFFFWIIEILTDELVGRCPCVCAEGWNRKPSLLNRFGIEPLLQANRTATDS
jgi:hypothetical protein